MRRIALALVTTGFVAGVAVPSFAQSSSAPTAGAIPQPIHVWMLADGGMCVQVESQPPVCSHPINP